MVKNKIGRLSYRVNPELLEKIDKVWYTRYKLEKNKKILFKKKVNYIEFILDKLNNFDSKSWDEFLSLGICVKGGRCLKAKSN